MPGAKTITDLMVGTDGLVYGLADSVDLFVFNPNNRQVVSVNRFSKDLGPSVYAQGTRAFVKGADGSIYVLLYNGIGKVDAKAHTVSRVAIEANGKTMEYSVVGPVEADPSRSNNSHH